MSRIMFSLKLVFMSAFPLLVHASNILEGPDDAPRGKIVGAGTKAPTWQSIEMDNRNNQTFQNRSLNQYQINAARNYSQSRSYDGLSGYPATINNAYYGAYGAYGYPNSLYDSNYGNYNYPNSAYNPYYGAGYPNSLYDSYYGSGNSTYENYYGNYGPSISPYNSYYEAYNSNYPYSNYSNPYAAYPSYRPYYPSGNMYNPNTVFINPPSSLNAPRYPIYSESYLYR